MIPDSPSRTPLPEHGRHRPAERTAPRAVDVSLHRAVPAAALVAVAVTWGITFSVVDGAVAELPPADLVAWRFGLGTLTLLLVRSDGLVHCRSRCVEGQSVSAYCWVWGSCCRPGRSPTRTR